MRLVGESTLGFERIECQSRLSGSPNGSENRLTAVRILLSMMPFKQWSKPTCLLVFKSTGFDGKRKTTTLGGIQIHDLSDTMRVLFRYATTTFDHSYLKRLPDKLSGSLK